MTDSRAPHAVRVTPVETMGRCRATGGFGDYALARVVDAHGANEWRAGMRVLALGDAAQSTLGQVVSVAAADCLLPPEHLDDGAALALPPLLAALGAWQDLQLELGEVAVVSGDTPFAALLALTAHWHGALPVVTLAAAAPGFAGGEWVSPHDPREAHSRIQSLQQDKPGFAAIDVSGSALVADILFQALPRWGRLHLGGAPSEALTVDFYRDVHVKGARVFTRALDARSVWPSAVAAPDLLRRAARLIECTSRRNAVLETLAW